jgi:hypothetical protein
MSLFPPSRSSRPTSLLASLLMESRMTTLKKYLSLFVLILALLVPRVSVSGMIDESSVQVTDVTPVQFSVVWGTSEAATGTVNVFADADGTKPVSEALINFESSKHPPAEDMGVIKVRVGNLQSNKSYYFQIESTTKAGGIVSRYPEVPPFMRIITEKITSVVHNDILAQQVSIGAGKPTQGTLVIATVEQADHPVTGWAGNGVPEGWVAIDMNNFYDKVTHTNLELAGGEPITLTYFCGSLGSVVTEDTVPPESGQIQSVKVAATLPGDSSGGGDSSAPTGSSGGGGGGGGAACFIATASDDF